MKTLFKFKNGAVRKIDYRIADLLERQGRGSYQTRELRAEPAVPPVIAQVEVAVENADPVNVDEPVVSDAHDDGFDDLSVEELRAIAEDRGVKVHHKAGAEKIIAALRGNNGE